MVVTVGGERFVQPGGSFFTTTIPNRPLTFKQQLDQAQSGVFINPQTGVAAFTASLDDADRKRRVRQDLAFATAIGGQLQQLGLDIPTSEGSSFLRPEQIGALIALRRGDDPLPILSGLGGNPIQGFSMVSQSLGTSAGGANGRALSFSDAGLSDFSLTPEAPPAESPAQPSRALPVGGLVLAAALALALGGFLLLRKR